MRSAVHGLFAMLFVATCALIAGGGIATASADRKPRESVAYGWPIKPCNQQHPVRAHLGAPRTIFVDPLEQAGLNGPGQFSFHNGIDIVAPAGTEVYAAVSGTVRRISGGLAVISDDGREFRYQHVEPLSRVGETVTACRAPIGRVQARKDHLHFVEVDRGKVVNPLSPGRLKPYADAIRPQIDTVRLVSGRAANWKSTVVVRDAAPTTQVGHDELVELVGRVRLGAAAHDLPALPVDWPREWASMSMVPLVPALLELTLRRPGPHRVAVRLRSHADFTDTVPLNERFWRVYRRGTHQSWPVIGGQWHKGVPGAYHFRFPRLDTRELPNGRYALRVTAFDTRGNAGSLRTWVRIKN